MKSIHLIFEPSSFGKLWLILGLVLVLFLAGCGGESTKDAMMRVARDRAAAKEEAEKEELALQAAQAASPIEQVAPPTPDTATPPPATTQSATPPPDVVAASPGPPATTVVAESSPPVKLPTGPPASPVAPSMSALSPPSTYVVRTNLLSFDPTGHIVAYSGDGAAIGVHDVETKALVRKAFNSQLSPTSVAMDDQRSQLVVGDAEGQMKVFSLGTVKGLDRYAQEQRLRRDGEPPLKAHSYAISALAVNSQAKLISSGDVSGEVRVWSSSTAESRNFTGGQGGFVRLQGYQKDQMIFGLTKQKKLVFWKADQASQESTEYATFTDMPTAMHVGPNGKGMVVGDDSGRVTMWLPNGSELKKQSFQAHSAAIAGIGFTANGNTLITASKAGEMLQWSLPLNSAQVVNLDEPARFLATSNNGRLLGVPSRKQFLDVYSVANGTKLSSFQVPGERRVTAGGFSSDNRVTITGDDSGSLQFFTANNEPFASLSLGAGSVDRLETARSEDLVAAALEDGTIAVVTIPTSDPSFIRSPPVDLAVTDEAGTKILAVSRTVLQVIETRSGGIVRSTPYSGANITAAFIDATIALVGNENGEVYSWTHEQEGAKLEPLEVGQKDKAISSIAITKSGQIWTCNVAGACSFSRFSNGTKRISGSFNHSISKVEGTLNGKATLLSSEGTLLGTNSLGQVAAPLIGGSSQKFSDFRTCSNGLYALTGDKRTLVRIDSAGNIIESVSVGNGHGEISKFDCGELSYSLLTKSGHLLAGMSRSVAASNQLLASGNLRSARIALNGEVVVVETLEGVLHVSIAGNRSQKVKLAGAQRLLALSPDGQALLVFDGARADCLQLDGELARVLFGVPTEIKEPTAACFSQNSRSLYLAANDGGIYQVSRNESAKADLLIKLDGKVSVLQTNSTGDRMLVRLEDGRAILLQVQGGDSKILFDSQAQKFASATIAGTRYLLGDNSGGLHEVLENPPSARELLSLGSSALLCMSGDASGQRCVVQTADKQLHVVNMKDGVWNSASPGNLVGDCLVLSVRENALTRVDSQGNLQTMPTNLCSSILGPESNVQTVANTADGRWLLAADIRGKLARWPVTADAIGKPLRSALNIVVDDLRAFPTGPNVSVLSKQQGLVSYNPTQDRVTNTLRGKLESYEIVAAGYDQTVAIKSGTNYRIADFHAGSLDQTGMDFNQADSVFQVVQDQKTIWLSASANGDYASRSQDESGTSPIAFQMGTDLSASSIRNELLQGQSGDTVYTSRADGSQLSRFKIPAGKIVRASMSSSSALAAACDSMGRVWFFGEGVGTPRSTILADGKKIGDIVWDATDAHIAVATEKGIYVIDATTTKVVSYFKTKSNVQSLVRFSNDGLWCVGEDQRLFKLKMANVEWKAKASAKATVLAWHAEDKGIVCGTASGTLTVFDARLGNPITKVECGKTDLRAVAALKTSDKLMLLAGTSSILSLDSSHRIANVPISSALQLRSIACDDTGRWLYASNNVGEILAWDLTNADAAPKTIPSELRSLQIRFVEGAKLASTSGSQPLLAISPSTASQNAIAKVGGSIEEFAVLPDDSYIAIADGTSTVQLAGLVANESRQLTGNSVGFRCLAVHPLGVRIAAAGTLLGRQGAKLALWNTADSQLVGELELPANPTRLSYSSDGRLIAVSMEDGGCQVFDGLSGVLLESLPRSAGLNTVEFTKDGRRVLLGKQDGSITAQALTSIGVVRAADSAITNLSFAGGGKTLLIGDAVGKISARDLDRLAEVKSIFQGITAPILQMKLSPDERLLLAVYDDPERSSLVWKLDAATGIPNSSAPDIVIRSPEARNTCVGFTSDSQYMLLGGEDGLIRAWSVLEKREVSRFRGHTSAVRDIAPYLEAGRFVSGGADNSIRTWRFPGNLPRNGDPVPDGALVDATEMQQVTIPRESIEKEDDRLAAARGALISGNPNSERAGEIFSLLSTNTNAVAEAKSSNSRLRALERNSQASLNDIYQERLRNSQILRRLQMGDSTFQSSKFENALMQVQTNFRFSEGEDSRPVKLRFSDRFLYAARPSVPGLTLNPDQPQPDLGDNGALLSWEFRVTQLPSREWLVDQIDVRELFSFPNYSGAIAAPSMTMFSQDDGSSTQLLAASSWDVSQPVATGKQLFALGSAGASRMESEILRIYDVAQLKDDKKQPVSRYTSYEGVLTALAFSNTSSRIAFCVRERAVHRLYVADAERLDATMTLIEEFAHTLPWIVTQGEPGAPGITSLAFTADDRTLVCHGRYDKQLYRLSAWKLTADSKGSLSAASAFRRENNLTPFLSERSSRPIRFILGYDDDIMIAEEGNRYVLWNITTGESRQIPFLPMQRGLPERSLSDDGKWLIMGDDRGNVYVYDVLRGERYAVAYTKEMDSEASTLQTNKKVESSKVVDRPAHSGPVSGVTLSPSNTRGDWPEFAASIGEENRMIIWDLIPVLGNRVLPPAKAAKRVAKQ